MIHGVCRTSNHVVPKCVIMQGKAVDAEKKAQRQVKDAVLEDDIQVQGMITSSVYDTDPIHLISTVTISLKLIQKKQVNNKIQNHVIEIEFLRMYI
mmetsp:Transcript_17220/g.38799  ORF Transcript_17220/g.38799 Transcript_17220/m.38799 type:complete len:96 (+) Transcript_17220:91-378(+)